HEGLACGVVLQRYRDRLQQRQQFRAQGRQQRRRVGELARLHALAQAVHELRGGGDADVGGEQGGLDLVQQRFVELRVAREQAAHAAREGAAAQARAPAGGAGRGRGGGRVGIGRGGRDGGVVAAGAGGASVAGA